MLQNKHRAAYNAPACETFRIAAEQNFCSPNTTENFIDQQTIYDNEKWLYEE